MDDSSVRPIILLAESDPETMAMYVRHLGSAEFAVCVCVDLRLVPQHVINLKPAVLVLNPSPNLRLSLDVLRRSMIAHPTLSVITMGDVIPDQYMDQLMRSGVSMHINRSLSQPRDLVVAVRQMLN